jgi:hypothetical protein
MHANLEVEAAGFINPIIEAINYLQKSRVENISETDVGEIVSTDWIKPANTKDRKYCKNRKHFSFKEH